MRKGVFFSYSLSSSTYPADFPCSFFHVSIFVYQDRWRLGGCYYLARVNAPVARNKVADYAGERGIRRDLGTEELYCHYTCGYRRVGSAGQEAHHSYGGEHRGALVRHEAVKGPGRGPNEEDRGDQATAAAKSKGDAGEDYFKKEIVCIYISGR